MNRLLPVLALFSLLCGIQCVDFAEECTVLASDPSFGSQCHQKPQIMWATCPSACAAHAVDQDEQCSVWAEDGQCASNEYYMHTQCAVSCGMAIAYDPFLRQRLGLLAVDVDGLLEQCHHTDDLLVIADMNRLRLTRYLRGDSNTLSSLFTAFTSPFYSYTGLAEAFLYSFRLFEFIFIYHSQQAALLRCQQHMDTLNEVLQAQEVDHMARSAQHWLDALNEVSIAANKLVEGYAPVLQGRMVLGCVSGINVTVNDMLGHLHPLCNTTQHDCSDEIPYGAYDAYNANAEAEDDSSSMTLPRHHTLSNGISLPLLGLFAHAYSSYEWEDILHSALGMGYRLFYVPLDFTDLMEGLIDTLSSSSIPREEVFIITSITEILANTTLKEDMAGSLRYFDLLLLDSPFQTMDLQLRAWQDMTALYRTGIVKSIGLSGFDLANTEVFVKKLQRIKAILPHALLNKHDVHHWHKQLDYIGRDAAAVFKALLPDVQLIGYSPFSGFPFTLMPIADPIVRAVAMEHTRRMAGMINEYGHQYNITLSQMLSNAGSTAQGADADMDLDGYDGYEQPPGIPIASSTLDNPAPVEDLSGIPWDGDSSGHSTETKPAASETTVASGTSPAQVLLRYALEQGVTMLFHTKDAYNLQENYNTLFLVPLTVKERRVLEMLQFLIATPLTKPTPL